MTRKATHSGTCQICGSAQKLPNGVLSLHGYTTRWGFFSGVCTGADCQPFELSKDRIEGAIASARKRALELRKEATIRELADDPTNVYDTIYVNHQRIHTVGRIEHRTGAFYDFVAAGVREHREPIRHCFKSLQDAATHLNQLEARRLIGLAVQHDQYVAWQTARIDGWTPHPEKLVPVEGSKPAKIDIVPGLTFKANGKTYVVTTLTCRGFTRTGRANHANLTCDGQPVKYPWSLASIRNAVRNPS